MNKETQKELLKIVEKNYQAIASSFSETREKKNWPFLINVINKINNNYKILDVGCGNGRLFDLFKEKDIEYIGVDNSLKLLKIAQKKYKNYPQAQFKLANILNLTLLPDINFDYIFCIAVLHHLASQKLQIQALRQLKNKIQSKGKIITSVWNLWEKPKYKKLIFKFWLLKLLGKIKWTLEISFLTGKIHK